MYLRKKVHNTGCQDPILSYFFDKILFCPIFWEMSYFILFFGNFAFNFGIFLSFYHHFTQKHSLKFFSLASLAIKILFAHIIPQPNRYHQYPTPVITTKGSLIDKRRGVQSGHGTGKTGNLAVNFSRQGKHREFSQFYFLHRENCANTGKILKI